jgi:ribose transport system substrate-binding protein
MAPASGERTVAELVVALHGQDNEFQLLQARDAAAAAKRAGLGVEVVFAENNAMLQVQQLVRIAGAPAAERPKAIVVEPVTGDGESLERPARKAAAAGIGWVLLNSTARYVEELRREQPQLPVFTVGSDQVEIGRIQGRQCRILMPRGGRLLLIEGPRSASAARERLQGLSEAIAGTGIGTVSLDGQWTEESAARAVRGWLRLRSSQEARIDVVGAQEVSMARGARRAFEELPAAERTRWERTPLLGIDGVPEVGQKLVDAGVLTATVVMPSNAGPAVDALARWLSAGARPPSHLSLAARSYPDEAELLRRAGGAPPPPSS